MTHRTLPQESCLLDLFTYYKTTIVKARAIFLKPFRNHSFVARGQQVAYYPQVRCHDALISISEDINAERVAEIGGSTGCWKFGSGMTLHFCRMSALISESRVMLDYSSQRASDEDELLKYWRGFNPRKLRVRHVDWVFTWPLLAPNFSPQLGNM